MFLPDTPKTIIERLVDPDSSSLWNLTWRRFFDLYHAPIKIMIGNSFFKRGIYSIPGSVIDDIVSDVIVSLNKIFTAKLYDRKKSLRKATCWDRRVTRRKASGAVGSARSVPSVHALGSKQLMVYSPDMKSM